ncbi:hypothetical protein [Oceanobacillus rekensis]|uniref:hypothetical protein n=1 Tax=Oceanobacillus rekensis TaxID=937927 RepID=UPI000B4318DB|nr:hypothetical protein [Oceanobacillus rekensis]
MFVKLNLNQFIVNGINYRTTFFNYWHRSPFAESQLLISKRKAACGMPLGATVGGLLQARTSLKKSMPKILKHFQKYLFQCVEYPIIYTSIFFILLCI